ncbi:MAG: glycosyltransferase [Candidatus Falkowbacteria bacterium]|nr:glycosyltransferase [Candidatus Falkowbacteria bacterium]
MKIIQVNKFNYLRGGAEKYFLAVTDELRRRGHDVAVFSMKHPKNLPSPWDKYFISRVSFNEGGLWNKIIGIGRTLYSFEAKRKFSKLVKDFKPDIIHVHNIYHHISPSILTVARKHNIPVIMHLHDYKLISPNYQLYSNNKVCYDGAAPNYFKCVSKKCFKDSYSASFLVALEMFWHHKVLKIYEKNIKRYIAPSHFMKDTCVRFGVPADMINVLYNFIDAAPKLENTAGNYMLYFGRLSGEKGIDVLLRALARLDKTTILKIAGTGPDEEKLKALTKELKLTKQVEFLGHLNGSDISDLIIKARAIIIPSVWLENMPFSLLESLAFGKVAIVSNIGGLAELIKDGVNGFSYPAHDISSLAKKIESLEHADLDKISQAAMETVKDLRIDKHVDVLLKIYEMSKS